MIVAGYTYLWLAWVSWTVNADVRVTEDSSLRCSFAIDDLEFDLCPLLKARAGTFDVSIDEETPPTRTQRKYTLGFGGALKWDGTLPEELQCPEGTRICLTVVNTRPNHPSEPSRILQVIPIAKTIGLDPKAKLADKINESDLHAPLQVTFHGGSYMHQTQKATFLFQCDPAAEPSTPSFLWQFNGTHAFSWKTKHACHKPLTGPRPHDPGPDPDPPQDPPKDPDSESGEKPVPESHSIMSIILWLALPSLILSRLLYFWLRNGGRHHSLIHFPTVARLKLAHSRALRFFPWSRSPSRGEGKGYAADEAGSELDEAPYYDRYHEEVPLTPTSGGAKYHRGTGQYGSF